MHHSERIRLEVRERVDSDGEIIEPLDENDVAKALKLLAGKRNRVIDNSFSPFIQK